MKNAIIYARVSTDEQASKGFGRKHQDDTLLRYCNLKNINIIKHYREDYSAKTFDRPEWIQLMKYCKTNRKNIDYILFTKWDRFSRNAGESYQVINELRKLGITPNAIEQPLDFEQPDNKIMLAIYLAVPEVENDKISVRVIEGTRKAKKEGCWTSSAPIGYKNQRTSDGKSSLAFSEKARLIKQAFKIIADTRSPVDHAWKLMLEKGLKVSRARFHTVLKNPVYMGKIQINAYKKEDELLVDGLHEGIISEKLYYKVQEVLDGRKRTTKRWSTKDENLPLRGYIECPECNNLLTGSASTGRAGRKYYYYHCRGKCKHRVKMNDTHQIFEDYLKTLTIDEGIADLYSDILKEKYGNDKRNRQIKAKKLQNEIARLKETISKAEDNLFEGKIDIKIFEKGKAKYIQKINDLEFEIAELKNTGSKFTNRINKSLEVFKNLHTLYTSSDWEGKQRILGSTFTEKIIFEKNKCRTTKLNAVLEHIYLTTSEILSTKKGQVLRNLNLSSLVGDTGFEPVTPCL